MSKTDMMSLGRFAMMPDRLAKAAFDAEERRQAVRRIAFGYGLSETQIDDVERLIDRIATETTMNRQQAESFVHALSDFDDEMRSRFAVECLGGSFPVFAWGAWFSIARGIMTNRKGEQLRQSLGLAGE